MGKVESVDYLKNIENNLNEKKFILQFIPKNLKLLIGDKKKVKYKEFNLKSAYLVDIVHSLIMKYYFTGKTMFNLSSLILREKYGGTYNKYMNYLIENQILYLRSDYFVGKKAKTYGINRAILSKVYRYKNDDKILLKKYKNNVLSLEINKKNYNWIEEDIRKKLVNDLFYIEIDFDKAEDILYTLENDDSFQKNFYSVECVKNKHIFYHFDNYGRCHTNFTVLKSDIRKKCLTIDGEEIEELDIRNSQPLFLTILIDENKDKFPVNVSEFDIMKKLVLSGEFYNYYMKNTGIKKKKKAKRSVYKVLFGKNLNDKDNKMFRSMFPTIHNFIILYKEMQGDYKSLAYKLQRCESNLLFNNIVKEIMCRYPYVKIFTVHDSISYPKKYDNQIREIFNHNLDLLFKN